MLKIRVMPVLLHADVGLVKGIGFDSWRRVGAAMQAVKVYNLREVDEMVLLDITATRQGRPPDTAMVSELAGECFVPLTVGGGVRSIDDVRELLMSGADKVAINTAALDDPDLVTQASLRFGSQCVVVSIDVRRSAKGYEVWTRSGTHPTGREVAEVCVEAEQRGAGEILITSIERDGTMRGYDVDLCRLVADSVQIPVIAAGGAGSYEDMAEVIREAGVSAVAAASVYHFTHQTPLEAKRYLAAHGLPVRL